MFYNPMFPKFKYTEGVKSLAQEANCYWLLVHIFSNQAIKAISEQPFQVWKLKVAEDHTATITVEDGNGNQVKSFQLTFTDFPLEEIDLWFIEYFRQSINGKGAVTMNVTLPECAMFRKHF